MSERPIDRGDVHALPDEIMRNFPECEKRRCRFGFHKQDESKYFVHWSRDHRDHLLIPDTILADANANIWGDHIRPWMETLHAEESPA